MERIAILTGMLIGIFMGLVIAQVIPKATSELEAMSAVIGATLGAAGGYLVALMAKSADEAESSVDAAQVFRPQVAGSTCVECGERILLMTDGVACQGCDRVVCQQCVSRHACPPDSPGSKTGNASADS